MPSATIPPADALLNSLAADAWKNIGTQRRSGVVAPLFSIYTSKSCGIGEFPDLKRLADWCRQTGMSIIQLLPMNDVGYNFRPYDAQSSFALEPMHLSVADLVHVDIRPFAADLARLKQQFPTGNNRVDYRIKGAKMALLWHIFKTARPGRVKSFNAFIHEQRFWLDDYALFKVIKEEQSEKGWEEWPEDFKHRSPTALARMRESRREQLLFQQWLQWQCAGQFKAVKKYATSESVLLMGDIPFLVSRDSADVWSHQEYFKLDLSSGAPPDLLYAHGQRWGMPPYNWDAIAAKDYDYVREKLRFAENFYDIYRIDHVVGIFRVWSIRNSEPAETGGLNGFFDPPDEHAWDEHGRRLLSVMIKNSRMLACAEDLGTIPPATFKTLDEFGIPGIDIQRWSKDWGKTYSFKTPEQYRPTALATLGTHDMSCFAAWWQFEAGTVDEVLVSRKCAERRLDHDTIKERLFDAKNARHGRLRWKKEIDSVPALLMVLNRQEWEVKDFIDLFLGSVDEKKKFLQFLGMNPAVNDPPLQALLKASLEKVTQSSSIFAAQLLQDWLSIDGLFDIDPWEMRINFPGTLDNRNWSLSLPIPLDDILGLPINSVLKKINKESGRI